MINERIVLKLPDGTKLVAESQKNIDYPAININHIDAENKLDTVTFAEYNPLKPFGQKLCAGVYQNHEEDTKFYDTFCHCIRPSFLELDELYNKYPDETYVCRICGGYVEIKTSSDDTVVYREFVCDGKINHEGYEIKLSKYGSTDIPVNYSFECFDCNDVIYSIDRPSIEEIDSNVEFEIEDITAEDCYKHPQITYLDDVEDECWKLFKKYAEFVGVKIGNGIDYSITKGISEKIMSIVERTFGIEFPISKGEC